MVFKNNWERTKARHNISQDIIMEMLCNYYDKGDIEDIEILDGGCANLNFKVHLYRKDSPVILRIYIRNQESIHKEFNISNLLKEKLPVPEFYYVSYIRGYRFAIIKCLPGITLRDYLLSNPTQMSSIMHKVGLALAAISKIKFSKGGFFNNNLEIEKETEEDSLIIYCFQMLENQNIKSIFSRSTLNKVRSLFIKHEEKLTDRNEKNLVHADLDPANILVDKQKGEWQVSGILDWEFAFSGSTLHDVSNMLRYSHKLPEAYTSSFSEGLRVGGYKIKDNWQIAIKLLNILSLLDCLKDVEQHTRPHQIHDIKELIDYYLL